MILVCDSATILDKNPWDSTVIFIFFCHFSVLLDLCESENAPETQKPRPKTFVHDSRFTEYKTEPLKGHSHFYVCFYCYIFTH